MGRMIDGDALIAQMEADAEQMEEPIAKMFTYAAIRDVKHAPTVEERRTGKWVWQTWSKYMCSECGRMTNVDECMEEPMYIYCPYCGAKMEGGE